MSSEINSVQSASAGFTDTVRVPVKEMNADDIAGYLNSVVIDSLKALKERDDFNTQLGAFRVDVAFTVFRVDGDPKPLE